jgi:acyl-CoA thioesterase
MTDPGDLSRRLADAMYANDRTCQSLGITLEAVSAGRAVLSMTLSETMVNGIGTAHGGYLFLLADAAFAYACNTHGTVTVAQSASVVFLAPAAPGDELVAEAIERTRSGRSGIYDVTVRHKSGQVIAEFRGHSTMLPGRRLIPDA